MAPTRPAWTARTGGSPKTLTVPVSGRVRPSSMSMVVDFPAPLGPRNATTSPGAMSRSTPRTAWIGPKLLRRPVIRMAAPSGEPAWPAP